jgi:hypothetical protein
MFESIAGPDRSHWKLWLACAAVILVLASGLAWLLRMTQMPLRSYRGTLPALSHEQAELAERLSADVKYLSVTVGERNLQRVGSLKATVEYLADNLRRAGYVVSERNYSTDGQVVTNVEVTLPGTDRASGTVVVGAHYDSVAGTVGANDNATGVAGVLELARLLQGSNPRRTIRFVLFVNEEPPYFQTENMGSLVYARRLHQEGVPVAAMISLETIGFYSDTPGSQKYPPVLGAFYPNRGDFIGFVGDSESRELVRRCVRKFREAASFPSEGVAAPADCLALDGRIIGLFGTKNIRRS